MKLIIVRHGEPNYEIDGLTEKGKVEAELVSRKLTKENISEIYCSVLGRARLTAEPTLKKLGMTAEYCEWLREFDYHVSLPYLDEKSCAWDLLPEFAADQEGLYSPTEWLNVDHIKNSDVPEQIQTKINELSLLISQ